MEESRRLGNQREISASAVCPAKAINDESVSVLQRTLDLEKLGRFERLLYKKYLKATHGGSSRSETARLSSLN
jgi:hypothetical protein